MTRPSRLRRRAQSFGHAARGIVQVLRSQPNARIDVAIAALVVATGVWLDVGARDWCWLVLAIALVLAAETMNTALEELADAAVPEHHAGIGRAKDAAAGAVLVTAVGALVIGLVILGPPLLAEFGLG